MRRLSLLVLPLALLTLSSSVGAGGSPLLSPADLPPGWIGGDVQPNSLTAGIRLGAETGMVTALIVGCGVPPEIAGQIPAGEHASVAFAQPGQMSSVVQVLYGFGTPTDAAAWLAGWRNLTSDCRGGREEEATVSVSPLAVLPSGADGIAQRFAISAPGVNLVIDLVVFTRGTVATRLVLTTTQGDPALLERLTAVAYERLDDRP